MSSSKIYVQNPRLRADKNFLIDLGIICGVLAGYHYGVHPLAKLVADKIGNMVSWNITDIRIPEAVRRRWTALIEAYRMHQRRGSLVRTIAYYVPFLPPTPRVAFGRYWNDDEYERVLGGTAMSHLRKFFRDDTYTESDDDDEDCGAAGLIYDFRAEADDITGFYEESRLDQLESTLWGTTDLTFFRPLPTCSTPSLPKKFDPLDDLRSVSEVSECNAATQAKVAALESELTEMRAMIAKILAAQNAPSAPVPTLMPQTAASPSAFVAAKPVSSAPPPPPPPPPPPMPSLLTDVVNSVKAENAIASSAKGAERPKPIKPMPRLSVMPGTSANITDVLKDLPSVKLRNVAKSPGGTPMRQPRTPNTNDPASMIAAALKTRFARMHSPSSEVEASDDDFDDKENSFGGNKDEKDSFGDVSPAKPRLSKRRQLSDKNNLGISVVCSNARKSLEAAMALDHVHFPETY